LDEKLKALYDRLSQDGYELPEYGEFAGKMASRPDAEKLYTTLVRDGYEVPDSFDGFYSTITPQEAGVMDYAGAGAAGFNRGVSGLVAEPLKFLGNASDYIDRKIHDVVSDEPYVPQGNFFTAAGEGIDSFNQEVNPYNPNVNETFQQASEGVGQILGMVATGGASGATGLATKTPSTAGAITGALTSRPAILGAVSSSNPEWEAAKEGGLSDEDALLVMAGNFLTGTTEAVPLANAIGRLNKLSGNKLLQFVKDRGIQGFEEGLQEVTQQYISNKIAQGSYDPERDELLNVLQSGKVGVIVGVLIPTAGVVRNSQNAKEHLELAVETNQVKNDLTSPNEVVDTTTQEAAEAIKSAGTTPTGDTPVVETPKTIRQEIIDEVLTPQEAADKFQGFITGSGIESVDQISEFADGKFKKRSEFESFIESYNDKNERKITDAESNKAWEAIREVKPKIKDTSSTVKMTEMGGLKKQITDFARGIKEGRIDAKTATKELTDTLTEKLGKSDVDPRKAKSIIRRIGSTNLLNPLKVQELIRYTENVAKDADYAEKLDYAKDLQSKIKKASSNPKISSFKPILKKLSQLNIGNLSRLDSVDEFISKAEGYVASTKSVDSDKYSPAELKSLGDYAENAFQESKLVGDEMAREALNVSGDFTKEELKYIYDESDEFYDNAIDTERKTIEGKLRRIASYSKMGLEGHPKLESIDVDGLTPSQLKKYIRLVDNLTLNGDETGIGQLEAMADAINGLKELKKSGVVANKLRTIESSLYNLPNISKAMFGLSKVAAKFRNATGINSFFGQASKVKTIKEHKANEFTKLVEKVNKKYGVDVNSRENIVRKGIVEYLHGYDQGMSRNETFLRKLANLERSIATHKAIDASQAGFEESIFNEFKNAKTIDDVNAIVKAKYPALAEVIKFDKEMFEEYRVAQHEANLRDDNRYAPIVEDYFPTKIRNIGETPIVDQASVNSIVKKDPSSAYGRNYNLSPSQIIDFSSNTNNFDAYQDMLDDIYVR
jgi:hypothetical protein